MKLYPKKSVLLRDCFKIASIIKKIDKEDKWLVSYYDDKNKFSYKLITEEDIIEEEEYLIIKNRINKINKLLD
jgi:hypothetical protein